MVLVVHKKALLPATRMACIRNCRSSGRGAPFQSFSARYQPGGKRMYDGRRRRQRNGRAFPHTTRPPPQPPTGRNERTKAQRCYPCRSWATQCPFLSPFTAFYPHYTRLVCKLSFAQLTKGRSTAQLARSFWRSSCFAAHQCCTVRSRPHKPMDPDGPVFPSFPSTFWTSELSC